MTTTTRQRIPRLICASCLSSTLLFSAGATTAIAAAKPPADAQVQQIPTRLTLPVQDPKSPCEVDLTIKGITETIAQWLAELSLSELLKLNNPVKLDPVMLYRCANYLGIFEKPKYTHPEDTGQPCRDAKGKIIPNTRVEGDKCVTVRPMGQQPGGDEDQQPGHDETNQQPGGDENQQPGHDETNQQPGGDEQSSTQSE